MDINQISFISLIFSLLSLVVAIASYRIARKALFIEEQRENRYLKTLNFELIRGLYINSTADDLIYIFIVSIRNASSSNKSLTKVVLNVIYTDKQDFNRKAFFLHDPNIAKTYGLADYDFAPLNAYLKPHETIILGFIFKVTKDLIKDNYIDVFKLVFEDEDKNLTIIDSILTTEYQIDSTKEFNESCD